MIDGRTDRFMDDMTDGLDKSIPHLPPILQTWKLLQLKYTLPQSAITSCEEVNVGTGLKKLHVGLNRYTRTANV